MFESNLTISASSFSNITKSFKKTNMNRALGDIDTNFIDSTPSTNNYSALIVLHKSNLLAKETNSFSKI